MHCHNGCIYMASPQYVFSNALKDEFAVKRLVTLDALVGFFPSVFYHVTFRGIKFYIKIACITTGCPQSVKSQ